LNSTGSFPGVAGLVAEPIAISGDGGDQIAAYAARPLDPTPTGGVVVIHHMPGYDEPSKEITRTFAARGYLAICPNLHYREAPGASPDDASAASRAAGGVPDGRLVGDVAGALEYLRRQANSNGKVAVIGYCSGGRQAFLVACTLEIDAVIDCYGAFVVGTPPPGHSLKVTPLADMADRLSCPMLGLFGADDPRPSPADTAALDKVLTQHGKSFEFHTYPDTGHAFFATDRLSYRPVSAMDGWDRIWRFLAATLAD
jgi:carboxymethylenebutenolidase